MSRPSLHFQFITLVAITLTLLCTGPAFSQRGPAAVRVAPVQARDITEQRMVTGELVAARRSRVASREAGLVLEMLVEDGQEVEAGQILARLDTARLQLTEAELLADAAVNEATVSERTAERDKVKYDLTLLQETFDRGAANPREMREAESRLAIAEARLVQAERQGTVLAARIDLIRTRLRDADIRAPFDGYVIATLIETGEWLGEGDAVVEMLSAGVIEAWLKVPELHLGAVRSARGVQVEVAGNQAIMHDSLALRVVPDVDPGTHSFYVVVTLRNDDALLAPGMSVRSWVPTGEQQRRLLVHRDALLRNDVGPYVFVARSMGEEGVQALPTQVRVLFPIGQYMAVDAMGLQEADLVVTEGNERLFPMAPIRPVTTDETAAENEA